MDAGSRRGSMSRERRSRSQSSVGERVLRCFHDRLENACNAASCFSRETFAYSRHCEVEGIPADDIFRS
jgi:hypothetical protein